MKKTIRIATVFSGIGAFEQALEKLDINYTIAFACDNGEVELSIPASEIKQVISQNKFDEGQANRYVESLYRKTRKANYMKKSYLANYPLAEDNWYEDIRFIDGNKYTNKIDLFVGGSPCQSFSIIGKRAGLEDVRGTLFYDFARLVKEIQPKVFLYENVPGMLIHEKGHTWKAIKEVFESLGYTYHYKILNSKDYGIPQDRRRLFVVGFKNEKGVFSFPNPSPLDTTMFNYLEKNVASKYYLGKKGFEFVTNPKYKNRARVNRTIIQTEKANQQFNWNGDFVFEKLDPKIHCEEILNRAYVGNYLQEVGVIRQLTPRECLRLMGFSDNFKIVVPDIWAYRQSGNSIVVNVLERIIEEILKHV